MFNEEQKATADNHSLTLVEPYRAMLGGGCAGRLTCACGWSHPFLSHDDAGRLWRAHLDGVAGPPGTEASPTTTDRASRIPEPSGV